MHSHVLPGIDDGAPDIETSVHLIKGLYDLGIRKMVATPHIIGDLYRNTPETIEAALIKTKQACVNGGISMELSAAAEYLLDDHFLSLLKKKQPLLTIAGNYLLTEFSYTMQPVNIEEIIFAVITEGYRPILAHPERYHYYHRNYNEYHRLNELGFHLQVNILSLTGYYGKPVEKAAKYILDKGLAEMVGTDLHHDRHLTALKDAGNTIIFNRFLGDKNFNNLFSME